MIPRGAYFFIVVMKGKGENKMVRAIVVDDQAEVRSALKLLLEESAGITEVAEAANLSQLLRLAHRVTPNLLLLDWDLANQHAGRLISLLHKLDAEIRIIVLDSSPQCRKPALDAGSDYFVCKGEPPEKLLRVIQEISAKNGNSGGQNVQG